MALLCASSALPFNVDGLVDELQEIVFGHLTIKELIALERVSKRWQSNVNQVLKGWKTLAVVTEERFDTKDPLRDDHFCLIKNHNFPSSSIVTMSFKNQRQVLVNLINKMPNLIAFKLVSDLTDFEDTESVTLQFLTNLSHSKLEHLEMNSSISYLPSFDVPVAIKSHLDCLHIDPQQNRPKLYKDCPRLKFYDDVLRTDLTEMLKNGIRNVIGLDEGEFNGLCENGSNVEWICCGTRTADQVQRMVRSLKNLKVFDSCGQISNIGLLKNFEHLVRLTWETDDTATEQQLTDYLRPFGHRLNYLRLDLPEFETGMSKVVAETCPNLEFLQMEQMETFDEQDLNIITSLKKLRILRLHRLRFGRTVIFEFLDKMPQIRFMRCAPDEECEDSIEIDIAQGLITKNYPNVVFEFIDG